jgi:glycine oxidase
VGFTEANTVGGLRGLLEAAVDLMPELKDVPVADMWSGLRPGTHDGNPVLGRDPDVDGLYYATGHFRNGILLAPLTAHIMGALISGTAFPSIPAEFRPRRAGSAGHSRYGT